MQAELLQMAESCHKEGAILKVILENYYLTDELKIIACRCAERAEADFVSTRTGFAAGVQHARRRRASCANTSPRRWV